MAAACALSFSGCAACPSQQHEAPTFRLNSSKRRAVRALAAANAGGGSSGTGSGGSSGGTCTSTSPSVLGAASAAASLSAAAAASAADLATGTPAAVPSSSSGAAVEGAAAAVSAAAASAAAAGAYVPGPVEVGWEIWVGFIAGVIPFAIATYEFSKRIIIQRRCPSCRGSGLIKNSRQRLVKCKECGGMLPWIGWKYFLFGTADVGNGGFLRQPRGQTSVFYRVPPPLQAQQQEQAPAPHEAGPVQAAGATLTEERQAPSDQQLR